MKVPLTNIDPWAEVSQMLAEANPALDISAVRPYRMTAGVGRNTRLHLVGNAAVGLAGKLYIDYDRLNPANVFSKFGDLSKHRPIRLYGLPGTAMKVSGILRQINDLLGINLTMIGDYRDIIDSNFTLPAKNAPFVLEISPYVSANGELPINLRLAPATKLTLNLTNGGVELKGLNRGLNPFVKTDGNFNWILADRPVNDLTKSRDLALYNLDFSDIFGTNGLLNGCAQPTPIQLPGYYQYGYKFKDTVVDMINAKLDRVGVAPLVKGRTHFVYAYGSLGLALSGDHTVGQGRTWAYTNSYMVNNAAGSIGIRATPPNINKNFSRVFKVLPTSWTEGTSYNDDLVSVDKLPEAQRLMYFHYDPL